jgi:toxin ParE1/3/4
MSLRIVFTTLAQVDIVDTTCYLGEHSENTAAKFFGCVQHSAQRLSEMPELGAVVQLENQSIRVWSVKDFPNHLIFYQIETDELVVFRVLHGSTDYETLFKSL